MFRAGTRAIFVHGFAKNEKDNIEREDLAALKRLAAEMLALCGEDDGASGCGDSPLRLGYVDVREQQIPKLGILKVV